MESLNFLRLHKKILRVKQYELQKYGSIMQQVYKCATQQKLILFCSRYKEI
jgi:hypothetical protein